MAFDTNLGIPYAIDLEIHNRTIIRPLYAKQYDKESRYIVATLYNNSDLYTIPTGATATFGCKKKNKNIVEDTATIENNKIYFRFTEQVTAVSGEVDAEFSLAFNGVSLGTPKFKIIVEEGAVSAGDVASADEVNVLTGLITDATTVISEANEAINEINTISDSVTAAETVRVSNENTRISNESARVSAENTRQSNETTRQANETVRILNESARVTAETNRETAEAIRVSNELARISAESDRVTAESNRETNTATAISTCNTASNNANTATALVYSALSDYEATEYDFYGGGAVDETDYTDMYGGGASGI